MRILLGFGLATIVNFGPLLNPNDERTTLCRKRILNFIASQELILAEIMTTTSQLQSSLFHSHSLLRHFTRHSLANRLDHQFMSGAVLILSRTVILAARPAKPVVTFVPSRIQAL